MNEGEDELLKIKDWLMLSWGLARFLAQ